MIDVIYVMFCVFVFYTNIEVLLSSPSLVSIAEHLIVVGIILCNNTSLKRFCVSLVVDRERFDF